MEEIERQLTTDIQHTLKLVPSSQRELFISELARYIDKRDQATRTSARAEFAEELRGWIERRHLGKGFDGSDRWEHCAAEIIAHIDSTLTPPPAGERTDGK